MGFDIWERCTEVVSRRFYMWERCTIDKAEQRLTGQDKHQREVKIALSVQNVTMFTPRRAKSYPHFLCISTGLICGNAARPHMGTLHGAKNDRF
ncbi:hypothetical protein B738_26792 [Photorhabdus temperata subsp. temperata M1021]|nr:hypothetical protein B738_26792 [Photorhabdus temperata subsp. temperata M1021]